MNLNQDKLELKIGYGEDAVIFHLRMISMAEETALRQRYTALKEDEKAEKDFAINVDALAQFSTAAPSVPGKESKEAETSDVPNAVRSYFAERSIRKERIADYAVRAFLAKITPEYSFL